MIDIYETSGSQNENLIVVYQLLQNLSSLVSISKAAVEFIYRTALLFYRHADCVSSRRLLMVWKSWIISPSSYKKDFLWKTHLYCEFNMKKMYVVSSFYTKTAVNSNLGMEFKLFM